MTALGEELGWRGYLQPRLDTAGVRGSFVVVGLCWSIYHAPFTLVDWSGTTAGLAFALAKGLVLDVSLSYLWAQLSYRAKSLWPAIFQHSFHNGVSQWLFPKFFAGGDETWLGEAACYRSLVTSSRRLVYQASSGGRAVVDSGRYARIEVE